MSKVKKTWITFISLFAALFLILGLAFGLPKVSAFANTYTPSSIFSAGTNGAVGKSEIEGEDATQYVQFTFSNAKLSELSDDSNGGRVHYRRDLALKWYSQEENEESASAKYFSMKFSFGDINFEKFTIDFESAEENISEDGKATNTIAFTKNTGGELDISVNGEETSLSVAKDDITIALNEEGDCKSGEFNVTVNGKETNKKFTNIGGYYLEYRSSSSSTPNTPITFTATFSKEAEASVKQTLLMKSLNNQPMELDGSDRVNDTEPAVLVLNEEVYSFKLGQKFSLSYKAIDVCDDSVTVTREYYMLKTVKEGENKTNYLPNVTELKDEEGENGKKYSSYNYKTLTTSTYFLPSQENDKQEEYVSIRFKLNDDTKDNDTYVYLSWYAAENATKPITGIAYTEQTVEGDSDKKEVKDETKTINFIKVDRDKKGPYYNYLEAKEATKKNVVADENKSAFDTAVSNYQTELEDSAKETSAGTGAYIYLPSLRELIKSDYAGYRNLKFSIYYYKPSQSEGSSASSQTSLNYNALKIEVTEKGLYKFRVIAQDSSSNAMQYYLDDELVTVSSSNVWDIEGIPTFTFEIDYKGPKIEETDEQSLGYRNDTYNFGNFDVIALTGYQREYKLYRYNRANATSANGYSGEVPSSYSDFVKNAEKYFGLFAAYDEKQPDNDKKILYEISPFDNDVDADDEARWNRTDNDYYWDPDSSLSFVPQEATFYILTLKVEDSVLPGKTAEGFQVVEVRNPIDTIPTQSQWLEENVVSVVLFAISGVLAIIVVVLFLVKPSDKKVEEVDLEKLKGKKKKTEKK